MSIALSIDVNQRNYALPHVPLVAVCIDGCAVEYLACALARRRIPHLAGMMERGFAGLVRGAIPSFTNVNNSAIVTGMPPAATGIGGNYFLDPATGQEVMTNSADFLRCETILLAAARAGRRAALVTAKEKLRDLLARDLAKKVSGTFSTAFSPGIAFSTEKAHEATLETHGLDDALQLIGGSLPEIYSGEASIAVLRAGAALVEQRRADFLYLTTTDYIQHKHAPDDEAALAFYGALDAEIGRLLELGARIAITADHGMNAKCDAAGKPNVVYLESELARKFGPGARVVCPITDPYVLHHGALGSAVTVYLPVEWNRGEAVAWIASLAGVTEVYTREAAAERLELPADRIGDLYVLSNRNTVLGRTPEHHDLSALGNRLRSHGGRYEEMVPLVVSHPLNAAYRAKAEADPRNFDLFDFLCNGME